MKKLLALSALTLATSVGTLVVVLVGSHRMKKELEDVKTRSNRSIRSLKSAIGNLEF